MIKVFALLAAKPGMTREAFQRHWREVHAPLVLRVGALRRYSQSHCFDAGVDFLKVARYDGIGEAWLDDLETATSLGENREYIEGARADEPNFLADDGLQFLLTRENVVIPGPNPQEASGIKNLALLKRKPGMTVAEFQDYWRNKHAPLVLSTPGATRYVQCHVAPETYEEMDPPFDGVAEGWAPDLASMEAALASESMQRQFEDIPNFLDLENTVGVFAKEHRVLWP